MIKKMGKLEKYLIILAVLIFIFWAITKNYFLSLGYALTFCGIFFSRGLEYLKIQEKTGGYGYIALAIVLLLYIILSKSFNLSIFTTAFLAGNFFVTGIITYKLESKSTAFMHFAVAFLALCVLIIISRG
ncbi:MAG: hypothetical protein Q4E36_02865 [Bacillota bacterium]|nr:hypothetical protein [Bacillota bacterium]